MAAGRQQKDEKEMANKQSKSKENESEKGKGDIQLDTLAQRNDRLSISNANPPDVDEQKQGVALDISGSRAVLRAVNPATLPAAAILSPGTAGENQRTGSEV